MPDPFAHLRVASSYSLRYGVSTPAALVARAAELGQSALALTDRDGVYGAVKFAQACRDAGIAPLLGVDLALRERSPMISAKGRSAIGRIRTPARGGETVDEDHPRVVVMARNGRGWAALCRLISRVHLTGERGKVVATHDDVAAHAQGGDLVVLLGVDSTVGRALSRHRTDAALAELRWWQDAVGIDGVRVEVASHRSRSGSAAPADIGAPGLRGISRSSAAAARLLGVAQQVGVSAVLSNAVRYADAADAPVADVLDAIRRLVPIDARHLDRSNAQGYLKSWQEMLPAVHEIARMSGASSEVVAVRNLLAGTRELVEQCALDPVEDLGLGDIHVPELSVLEGRPSTTATDVGSVLAGYSERRRSHTQVADEARRAQVELISRCEAGMNWRAMPSTARARLEDELMTIRDLGFAGYFLTVAEVVDIIRGMGVRVAARGSGAGSLVNYLLGISGVDPIRYDLLMERFLSPLRRALPDIDVDVESARRPEVYERILDRFGGDRCACVSMRDTYRVRHAVRDVGTALGMPAGEVDSFAKAFPHIRASEARAALRELPELRDSGLGRMAADGRLEGFLSLVESLDGLPRPIAVHPCGVLLSDATMLDRTPVESSWAGFPMSQFDKDDVEALGLLKLDVLGIRMQSAMQHAVAEVRRVDGIDIDLDSAPLDDPGTFELIRSTRTLGCFQIESPGQRELLGKFAPETFDDIIVDISLFRPGPVKSDMITPFLAARHGWQPAEFIHDDLRPALAETQGVVVFHEQVIRVVSVMTGCSYAEADEVRRSMGSPEGQLQVRGWFYRCAGDLGYSLAIVERVWEVLRAFASFGFCKAHAAAFALPTYQSAWLKRHHTAAFLAGVLTHDPGMYPKRLILDDARNHGIGILPLDVNLSGSDYRVERGENAYCIRLALSEVKGISAAEVTSICGNQPFVDLPDYWERTEVSRPVTERLILTGAFDLLHGITLTGGRSRHTRRDLLLQAADLDRWSRRGRGRTRSPSRRGSVGPTVEPQTPAVGIGPAVLDSVSSARRQSKSVQRGVVVDGVQTALDLTDAVLQRRPSGLPEMSIPERVHAELEILGLDASAHLVDFYAPMLSALAVTRSSELLERRSSQEILVAGVKVATQTPPVRSGRRVVFLTLDDGAGPVDATFFPDAQDPYAQRVFHSWLLLVRGKVRRTGPRGVSLRATGCWELPLIRELWLSHGVAGVQALIDGSPHPDRRTPSGSPVEAMAASDSATAIEPAALVEPGQAARRVLVYASGFRKSPYSDIRPAGGDASDARAIVRDTAGAAAPVAEPGSGSTVTDRQGTDAPDEAAAVPEPPSKLWHSSPGSPGW